MKMKEQVKQWRNQHAVIDEWLNNFQANTQKNYATYAFLFFKWIETEAPEPYLGKTPEELLDMQDRCVRQRERFEQVELLKKWINTRKGAYGTKQQLKMVIYAFYASNHVPLPKDTNWKAKPDHATVNGAMTVEEIKQIILSSNKLYQAVYTIMFQSSMGIAEFQYFNTHAWPQVKEQLDQGKQIIRVDLPGRKHRNMRPGGAYFTFFGKDGITKLKEYLEVRGQHNRQIKRDLPKLEDAIFITENWRPLTKHAIMSYFKRHAWILGMTKRRRQDKYARYRIHTHELRDTFRTEWNLTKAKGFMAEFFMGHVIDSNHYNKVMSIATWAEEQYRLAEPFLNILSEDPRTIETKDINKIVEARLQEKTDEIRELRDKLLTWERSVKRLEKVEEDQHTLNKRLKQMEQESKGNV